MTSKPGFSHKHAPSPEALPDICREIVAWHRTGILEGEALREYASTLPFPDLQQAEHLALMAAAESVAQGGVALDPSAEHGNGEDGWDLSCRLWPRASTQEWVLEISGSIADTFFICRHTEPLSMPPQDVPGLRSRYPEDDLPAAPGPAA